MIINKFRQGQYFTFQVTLMSDKDSHGKFADHISDIDQIINAHLDGLKIKLNEYLSTIPDKVG